MGRTLEEVLAQEEPEIVTNARKKADLMVSEIELRKRVENDIESVQSNKKQDGQ